MRGVSCYASQSGQAGKFHSLDSISKATDEGPVFAIVIMHFFIALLMIHRVGAINGSIHPIDGRDVTGSPNGLV